MQSEQPGRELTAQSIRYRGVQQAAEDMNISISYKLIKVDEGTSGAVAKATEVGVDGIILAAANIDLILDIRVAASLAGIPLVTVGQALPLTAFANGNATDPTCANGIAHSSGACCTKSCGKCGGSGCGGRPGGAKSCCSGTVKKSAFSCRATVAPCVLEGGLSEEAATLHIGSETELAVDTAKAFLEFQSTAQAIGLKTFFVCLDSSYGRDQVVAYFCNVALANEFGPSTTMLPINMDLRLDYSLPEQNAEQLVSKWHSAFVPTFDQAIKVALGIYAASTEISITAVKLAQNFANRQVPVYLVSHGMSKAVWPEIRVPGLIDKLELPGEYLQVLFPLSIS